MSTATANMSVATALSPDHQDLERIGYLFGHPIAHSMSPLLHQTVYDGLGLKWRQLPFDSTDMSHFLQLVKDPKFYGASVTMPHKVSICQYLDAITPEGQQVGACNTIFVQESNGRRLLIGTNTDVVGIRDAFYENVTDPEKVFHHRPGLVIGGGGAARSAVYALNNWMKCPKIYIVNRDKDEVDAVIQECKARGYGDSLVYVQSVEHAEELEGPGAIVSCVPDFPPKTEAEILARKITEVMLAKPHKGAILEMCYHPTPWTRIAELSRNAGWEVILGTEAMIWQGLEQDKYWTGKTVHELPVQQVHTAIAKRLGEAKIVKGHL